MVCYAKYDMIKLVAFFNSLIVPPGLSMNGGKTKTKKRTSLMWQKQDSMSRKNTPEVLHPLQVKVCSVSASLSFIHVNKGVGKANTDWEKRTTSRMIQTIMFMDREQYNTQDIEQIMSPLLWLVVIHKSTYIGVYIIYQGQNLRHNYTCCLVKDFVDDLVVSHNTSYVVPEQVFSSCCTKLCTV